MSKPVKTIFKIIGIIIILVIIALVAWWAYTKLTAIEGLYVEYNGSYYDTSSDGVIVESFNLTFTINSSSGWGLYSVKDCTVRIISNTDDAHSFEFTLEDDYRTYIYSGGEDLTAAFVSNYNGSSIEVASDGSFTITIPSTDVIEILTAKYGSTASSEGEYRLTDYPYIALYIVSPDGSATLTLPIKVKDGLDVYSVNLDSSEIVF